MKEGGEPHGLDDPNSQTALQARRFSATTVIGYAMS